MDPRFQTTRWSMVVAAGAAEASVSHAALADLCEAYWYPLYAFVRRQGHAAEEARDLTQAYFAHLLEKNYVADADCDKGRFRTFLIVSLKHFLAHEREKSRAQKRGGGLVPIPLELDTAEASYRIEVVDNVTPQTLFEHKWAETVMERARVRLCDDYSRRGDSRLFLILEGHLTQDAAQPSYKETASRLEMSEDAIKTAVSRLRRRFGKALRTEIEETVLRPEDVDDEIRFLFATLRSEGTPRSSGHSND